LQKESYSNQYVHSTNVENYIPWLLSLSIIGLLCCCEFCQ